MGRPKNKTRACRANARAPRKKQPAAEDAAAREAAARAKPKKEELLGWARAQIRVARSVCRKKLDQVKKINKTVDRESRGKMTNTLREALKVCAAQPRTEAVKLTTAPLPYVAAPLGWS